MKLYIDFDGVILDTIDVSYKQIKEKYGENVTAKESEEFYRAMDWYQFLRECNPINNSIKHIQALADSGYYDVAILTHVWSKHEQEEKEKYIKEMTKNIQYIPVLKPTPKWQQVECENAILVDDYSKNLTEWEEHGGIAIKFSLKKKSQKFYTIQSLEELMTCYDEIVKISNNKKKYHLIKK